MTEDLVKGALLKITEVPEAVAGLQDDLERLPFVRSTIQQFDVPTGVSVYPTSMGGVGFTEQKERKIAMSRYLQMLIVGEPTQEHYSRFAAATAKVIPLATGRLTKTASSVELTPEGSLYGTDLGPALYIPPGARPRSCLFLFLHFPPQLTEKELNEIVGIPGAFQLEGDLGVEW